MAFNFDNMCRLCMDNESDMISLFGGDNVAEKVMIFIPVLKVSLNSNNFIIIITLLFKQNQTVALF